MQSKGMSLARQRGQKEKIDLLRGVPLFAGLSKRELGALAQRADEITVKEGADVCRQGALGNEFMIMLSGSAVVQKNKRKVAELGPGDMFGEISIITELPRNATVTASTDADLLVMHRRDFSAVMDQFPTVAAKVLRTVAARLSTTP